MNFLNKGLQSKNRNSNGCFYIPGFSEQIHRKQRELEREKVNIVENSI